MKKDFKQGSIIEYNKSQYKVIENFGEYGKVVDSDGEIISPFYWDYDGFESIMIASKEVEVTRCSDCPAYSMHHDWTHLCGIGRKEIHMHITGLEEEDYPSRIPVWCPLKSGPIIVRLKG